ncbi:MAG: hypothetical protein JWR69_79 [Pedosphaera sp.]|nr:hypothetical protein [Pedosphaera sp.]
MIDSIYAGPGKIFTATKALWPEGENGMLKYDVEQERNDVSSSNHGRITATGGDVTTKVSLTPFDNWGALSVLYPTIIKTPAIGSRAHGAADVPATIWTPDGRKYLLPRVAVTKHPELHLGVGKALYGPCEFTGLIATAKNVGDVAAFHTITESAAADPGGVMTMADFIREAWTGVWGTVAGFGGDGGSAIQAEEEWVISVNAKYSALKVQKLTRSMKLDSVEIMAKLRPVGPTHTQIDAALAIQAGRLLGQRFSTAATDLVLTSASAKTITLKNADIVGAGFEFGGTKLGTGEIGFVTGITFTAGVVQPLIVFSA